MERTLKAPFTGSTVTPEGMSTEERRKMARQVREVKSDMAVFARVLEATRSNLNVMKRLRELRAGRLEYTERQARGSAEGGHGDH